MLIDQSVANSKRYRAQCDIVDVDTPAIYEFLRRNKTNLRAVCEKADLPVGYSAIRAALEKGRIAREYIAALDDTFDENFYDVAIGNVKKSTGTFDKDAFMNLTSATYVDALAEEWHLLHDGVNIEVNGVTFRVTKRKLEEFLRKEGVVV